MTNQPNIYSSLTDTSVGVWPCVGVGIINGYEIYLFFSAQHHPRYRHIVPTREVNSAYTPRSLVISPHMDKLHYFKSFTEPFLQTHYFVPLFELGMHAHRNCVRVSTYRYRMCARKALSFAIEEKKKSQKLRPIIR